MADTGQTTQPAAATIESSMASTGRQIADILVLEGLITAEKLHYALRVMEKLHSDWTLTRTLRELKYVTSRQIMEALRKHRLNIRIGDLLVELNVLSSQELHAALNIQKDSGGVRKLGQVLVESGFIAEEKLAEILSLQLGFPFIALSRTTIDPRIINRAPIQWYCDNDFIPVAEEEGVPLIAFADPMDKKSLDAAAKLFGPGITIAIATRREIHESLERLRKKQGASDDKAADESTIIGIINSIFDAAIDEGASDIHLEPMRDRLRIRLRRDGVLSLYKDFPKDLAPMISTRIKVLAEANIAERRRHQDGRILYESSRTSIAVDFRVSIYVTIHGEKLVLRLLTRKAELLDIKDIGMPPRMLERFMDDALETPSGVLIITGPTGSGKTTSMYSCINHLNNLNVAIVTAEDPVEYVIDGIHQCSINPKLGVTFEETLRHIVRQDPDVVVLGEIRDTFSAETAIQAALTGHKVLTTFHTEDSIGGLLRLLNMDIEAFLISSTVVCVVAQRLLRRVCPSCAKPYQPTSSDYRRLGCSAADLKGAEFLVGSGCKSCRYTGYRGRVGIFEMLVLNEHVKDAILAKKTSYEIRRLSIETSGLVTLLEAGLSKASLGLISLEDVLRNLPRLDRPRPIAEIRRLVGE